MKPLFSLIPKPLRIASKLVSDVPIQHVTSDSRAVKTGSLYFAIRGTKSDGHEFIPSALESGAAAVVVETPEAFEKFPGTVQVVSSRQALALAAAEFYERPSAKFSLVGITGTNGKTTTSYLLRAVWEALGITNGVLGTVEYHIGRETFPSRLTTPDPVELQSFFRRMVDARVKMAAIEVSSIALDQDRVTGSDFKVGVFTNLTQDHLDYHGDLERYYLAKKKLFTEFSLAHAVINVDDEWGARLAGEIRGPKLATFSLKDSTASFFAESISFEKQGTSARVRFEGGTTELRTPLIGRHNLYNCLGVFATGHVLGLPTEKLVEALADASGAPGRLERVTRAKDQPHVFVDYAHTPDALANVLRALSALKGNGDGRIITVFGCGGDRDRTKRPLMADFASSLSEITVATSDNPRTEDPERILNDIEAGIRRGKTEYHRRVNRREAIHLALRLARPGDLVLVAGKGHETYQIIGKEQFPFDDRSVIREYYESR